MKIKFITTLICVIISLYLLHISLCYTKQSINEISNMPSLGINYFSRLYSSIIYLTISIFILIFALFILLIPICVDN